MDRKIFFIIVMTAFCATMFTCCKKDENPVSEEHPISFTVTFNTNSGSWVQSQSITSGSKVTEPAPPMRNGYTFDGWYKDSELTQKWNFATEIVKSDLILYAKWDAITSGTIGGLLWRITSDGTLIISDAGTGMISIYGGEYVHPWYPHRDGITAVIMENGVPHIGSYAFYRYSNLASVTIPNSVRSIGDNAFWGCSSLTGTLIIPNSVTSIGSGAFAGCSGLTSITIPNSVTRIGGSAFNGCSGLTAEVTIPNSVTSIGIYAFASCTNLTEINVDAGNSAYISENGVLYNRAKTVLMQYPAGKTGAYTIPNSVEVIESGAFSGTRGLTSVTMPNSITSIGAYAFSGSSVTSINIPSSVTSIESGVFYNCTGLTSITIPNSVTTIGDVAFSGCSGLTEINIGNSLTYIEEAAFSGCSSLMAINVDDANGTLCSENGVLFNKAKTWLIQYPAGRKGAYTIPNTVTAIGREAFYGSSLTSITIPYSVSSIGNFAFYNCRGLTEIINQRSSPQTFGRWGSFSHEVFTAVTLRVPAASVVAYKATAIWKEFVNIVAI